MEDRFQTFTIQIAKINRYIRKIKSEEMSKYNLKTAHTSCLYYLYKNNGTLTSKELCDICDEDKASISRALEYLEKEEYIYCLSKAEKRYKTPLTLTEKGNRIGKEISNKIDGVVEFACQGNSDNNRQQFYKYLTLLEKNLEDFCKKYGDK